MRKRMEYLRDVSHRLGYNVDEMCDCMIVVLPKSAAHTSPQEQ